MNNIWIRGEGEGFQIRRAQPNEPGAKEYVMKEDLVRVLSEQLTKASKVEKGGVTELSNAISVIISDTIRKTVYEINDNLNLEITLED